MQMVSLAQRWIQASMRSAGSGFLFGTGSGVFSAGGGAIAVKRSKRFS
jgi:hypothetical protein